MDIVDESVESATDFIAKKKNKEPEHPSTKTYLSKKDDRIVRGIFKNLESPGCVLKFAFRCHKKEPIATYELEDGKEYEIPLSVARHLNQNCHYPVHSYLLDANGFPLMNKATQKVIHRFSFSAVDYH